MDNKQSWTIGILCYNEEDTIGKVANNAIEVLKEISNGDYEILIIEDGSADKSAQRIKEIEAKKPEVKGIYHSKNLGIGEGIRSVYFNATKENVIVTPGDGQFNYNRLKEHPVLAQNEFVAFYRKENLTYSSYRVILSLLNRRLNKILIGLDIKDVNWSKVFKSKVLADLQLQLHSSLVESEICAKLLYLGFKAIEIESEFLPRVAGKSTGGSWKIVKKAMRDLITLIFIIRKFKSKNKRNSYAE